jgi:cell division protein FtsQ
VTRGSAAGTSPKAANTAPSSQRSLSPGTRNESLETRRRADRMERAAARAARRAERSEARRFTRRSRRRRLISWGAIATFAIFISTVLIVTLSPLMSLTDIRVTGTTRLDAAAVSSALENHRGTPLALVDEQEIRNDLRGFVLIRSYSLEIVPPNSLVVRIVERTPIGAIERGSAFDLVDAAGVVIESAKERPIDVPLLRAGAADPALAAFRSVTEVLDALPDDLQSRVDVVTATTRDDVSFTIRELGHRVVWGGAERSAYKSRVLEAAIAVNDPAVSWQFDVSAPDSVIVRQL